MFVTNDDPASGRSNARIMNGSYRVNDGWTEGEDDPWTLVVTAGRVYSCLDELRHHNEAHGLSYAECSGMPPTESATIYFPTGQQDGLDVYGQHVTITRQDVERLADYLTHAFDSDQMDDE